MIESFRPPAFGAASEKVITFIILLRCPTTRTCLPHRNSLLVLPPPHDRTPALTASLTLISAPPPPNISLAALVMMRRYTVHGEYRVISVAVKEEKNVGP